MMQHFLDALNWFAVGAAVGYFWHPVYSTVKKIFVEAVKARKEW
jgi:hypothetical protein